MEVWVRSPGPNVSTTPLRQWGFRQCLPFSWTTLRSKHCRHPIAVMGVVDTFGPGYVISLFVLPGDQFFQKILGQNGLGMAIYIGGPEDGFK